MLGMSMVAERLVSIECVVPLWEVGSGRLALNLTSRRVAGGIGRM